MEVSGSESGSSAGGVSTFDRLWHDVVARWKTAYGHAYAAQGHLIDLINAQSQGHDENVIRIHMRIVEEIWTIEARCRAELNRHVKRRFG